MVKRRKSLLKILVMKRQKIPAMIKERIRVMKKGGIQVMKKRLSKLFKSL